MDTYYKWNREGILDEKLKQISILRSNGLSLVAVAKKMFINYRTLDTMIKNYPDVKKAADDGKVVELENIMSALLKRALGHRAVIFEDTYSYDNIGVKKLTQKKNKELYFPPDNEAINRILEIRHGIRRSTAENPEGIEYEDNYEKNVLDAAKGITVKEIIVEDNVGGSADETVQKK